MKNKIIFWSLIGLALVTAFFSWFAVDRAIKVPDASHWIAPIVWVSFFIIGMCLLAVLVREKYLILATSIVSFSLSLFFVHNFWHLLILLASALLFAWGLHRARKDLSLNIKISIWKSLLTGKTHMILALALIISSQYFFTIENMDGQKVLPKFDLSSVSSKILVPLFGVMNPNFKAMQKQDITVDQFILKTQDANATDQDNSLDENLVDAQIPSNIPLEQREVLKAGALEKINKAKAEITKQNSELILQEGRKQLSTMVGKEIRGNEKMADVFSGLVNKKINDYFQPQIQGDSKSSLFSFILALVLFLTIAPLGSILSRIWFLLVIGSFKLMVKYGLVEIKKEMVEKESIQY